MKRYAWKARVLPDKIEEYEKRHDEIWPEMKAMFREAGIHNYSIWNVGDDLFGYYECDSIEKAASVQVKSIVTKRWKEYMKDVLEMGQDSMTGAQPLMRQVFLFEE